MCIRRLKASSKQEGNSKLKKSKLISGKRFAGFSGLPSTVVLLVAVSVIMTVCLALISGQYLQRATRRKSRTKETPLDWHLLPGPSPVPMDYSL